MPGATATRVLPSSRTREPIDPELNRAAIAAASTRVVVMPRNWKYARFRTTFKIDASSVQDAVIRSVRLGRERGRWPSRPPVRDRMPDRQWRWLQARFDLPEVTPEGVDIRAYLEILSIHLREARVGESRQPPLRLKQRQLAAIRSATVGAPMPRLHTKVAELLAGMGMLDKRFGGRDPAKYRTALAYILTASHVTELIRDWAEWAVMFGAAQRSHDRLHGGESSLAEVAAVSDLITFTRDVLAEPDANWFGVSTRDKRIIGTGRRARVEAVEKPIAGWQTHFIRAFLALAGLRDSRGRPLRLAAVRQRVERCRDKMEAGVAAGYGATALWEFLEARTRVFRA